MNIYIYIYYRITDGLVLELQDEAADEMSYNYLSIHLDKYIDT
jgi:hypothetical protein